MFKITQLSKITALFIGLLFGATAYAQVGIGTTTPRTGLDVNAALSIREGTALPLINGNNNNINLGTNPYSNYRITSPTATFSITGIVPVANSDGQLLTLVNTTAQVMRIAHNVSSTTVNRIYVPGGQDLYLTGRYSAVTLQYNLNLRRWIVQNKLEDITSWVTPATNINANTQYTLTYNIPNVTSISGVSVNLLGDWAVSPDVTIEHVEAKTGQVKFVVTNNTGIFGTNYLNMDFVIIVTN